MRKGCWISSRRNPVLIRARKPWKAPTEREKRNGTIQKLANGDYKFMTEVYDASEMIPWIKTFRGRIVEIKCSNERVEKQIKEDFEMMKRIYEVR